MVFVHAPKVSRIKPDLEETHAGCDGMGVILRKIDMEKILLAMDGYKETTVAVDFACYLAKLTDSRLVGAFLEGLPDVSAGESRGGDLPGFAGELAGWPDDPVLGRIRRFQETCVVRDVAARVHRDRGVPLTEVLKESRFSDLIVVDPETSFRTMQTEFPGRFLRDVLLAAECPVIVSPYRFEGVDEVIFAYNGTGSSVFAIKQFTYLFPVWQDKKAIVVHVSRDGDGFAGEQPGMQEWLSAHYADVDFVDLKGEASDELFGYLLDKENAVVVLGAYGRGILSRFLKPSHASLLLRTINLPIFIAHR
jgi:nucleotide-binding universal stress UspA family protein